MKKTIAIMMAALAAVSATLAEPGFIRAVFTGSNYNDSSPVLGNSMAEVVLSAGDDFYAYETPTQTTYAYAAYMWMEGGVDYYFGGQYDDYCTVKVDNFMVVRKGGGCSENFGVVKFSSSAWHKVEFRVANAGGSGGAKSSYVMGGIWFKKALDGEWCRIADSGNGDLFKTELNASDISTASLDSVYQYTVSSGKVTIVNVPVVQKDVTFPGTIDGKAVALGSSIFGTQSVRNVTIPAEISTIDPTAFIGCPISRVIVEEGNTKFKVINECLVSYDGTTLYAVPFGQTAVVIPNGVLEIPKEMFKNATSIQSVSFPQTLSSIGESAFEGCSGLRSINLPDSVTFIGRCSFKNCSAITNIIFSQSLAVINEMTFNNCSSLQSLSLPPSVIEIGRSAFNGCYAITDLRIPGTVKTIGDGSFANCTSMTSLVLEEGVERLVNGWTFSTCSSLSYISLPSSLNSLTEYAFTYDNVISRVDCWGVPPANISSSAIPGKGVIYCLREYGCQWLSVVGNSKFGGYLDSIADTSVEIVSSSIRDNDPTVMDIVYKVTSTKPTVKVRVLAFEDGERSFAKVVRPETFIEGTAANIGDNIAANMEHTLSWKVSSDWQTRLAKMKFEVLACEGGLLPMEWMTIPASDTYGKMKFSWNAHSESQLFDALLWLYADKDPGLTLASGVLRNSGTQLASGAGTSNPNAIRYIYSKMGYNLLSGSALNYVNAETRLGLSPSGARQYAYKIVGDAQ